jgi:integrase
MLLTDLFETMYRPIRLLNASPRTLTLYRYSVRIFGDTLGRSANIDDLNDLAIANHLQRLLDSGHSPGSASKERSQLLALWNFAAKRRMLDTWPGIAPIPKPESVPAAWTEEQLWRIRISCNFAAGNYHGVPANRWWLALHVLLYATGERITAVRHLRWADLSGTVLVIPAENRKGRRRPIVKHLGPDCMGVLEEIKQPARDLIFPFPFTETYLYRIYHKILARAELPTDRNSKFHRIRRTHATHLKAAGGDPSISLGHSNPAVTARYIDPRLLPSQDSLLPPFPTRRTGSD